MIFWLKLASAGKRTLKLALGTHALWPRAFGLPAIQAALSASFPLHSRAALDA